jgi:crotonobetainyl-CoA:carnitine CoA-transferase CaiB-like acyl-CoA transferase
VSVALATQFEILAAPMKALGCVRCAGGTQFGKIRIPMVWRAFDGYVSFLFLFGSALGVFSRRFMEYLCEIGGCDEAVRDKDWLAYGVLLDSGEEPIEEWNRVVGLIEDFTKQHTKAELLALALERGFLFAPAATMEDLATNPHFEDRHFFEPVEHPEHGRSFRYPGAFARMSADPIRAPRRAPRIGEHNDEIANEPVPVRAKGPTGSPSSDKPLAGVKILDLMWVMAGPVSTRMLADLGAEIIRIESPTRVDTGRTLNPMQGGEPDGDRSAVFGNCNAGKLGLALDLSQPVARDVVLDLVRWADVVTESFAPGTISKWNLGYEDLCRVKSDIIMLSSCLMGQTGPLSGLAGYGTMGAAVAGFHNVTGFPDRDPDGLFSAYTDFVSPRYAATAVLAALEHHRQTGVGGYIDLSQIEASIHFLAPSILDWTVNGREAERIGNADRNFAPHGVFRAAGVDRWVAVACRSDEEWQALCGVVGRSDLAVDARFAKASDRMAHGTELEAAIEKWTSQRDASEIERTLQGAGIAAHQVQDSALCFADEQFQHRGHFVELPHPVTGTFMFEGPRALLSRTPARVERAAPTLGEHNQLVLSEVLGYDDDKITELVIAGALG